MPGLLCASTGLLYFVRAMPADGCGRRGSSFITWHVRETEKHVTNDRPLIMRRSNPLWRLSTPPADGPESSPTSTIVALPALGSTTSLLPASIASRVPHKARWPSSSGGLSLRAALTPVVIISGAEREGGLLGSSTASNASTDLADADTALPAEGDKWRVRTFRVNATPISRSRALARAQQTRAQTATPQADNFFAHLIHSRRASLTPTPQPMHVPTSEPMTAEPLVSEPLLAPEPVLTPSLVVGEVPLVAASRHVSRGSRAVP